MAMRCWYMVWYVLSFAVMLNFADGSRQQQQQQPRSIPSKILRAKIPFRKQQQQLWLYEGALFDPLDGRRIATVKGLELVSPVEDTTHLAIDGLLNHPNATYQDSKTIWSQKIFCYTTTTTTNSNNNNNNNNGEVLSSSESILDSVRVRPRSPRKHVPLDQAVIVYETATTFIARNKTTTTTDEIETNDEEILVHSEWPNGQTMWGKATRDSQRKGVDSAAAPRSIDFTIFAKLRNKNSPLYAPDLQQQQDKNNNNNGDVIVSPKRAALVQFGSSSGKMESLHKYGARETYSYRNLPNPGESDATTTPKKGWFSLFATKRNTRNRNNNNVNTNDGRFESGPTLYYTRYGEGPPFYAPGRMCMLELRGRPVRSLREVGPLLKGLLPRGSDGTQTQGNPPPLVTNFNWRENDSKSMSTEEEEDDDSPGSELTATSLQTAWNLKQRPKRQSSGSVASLQNNRRRTPFEQPLVLQLAKESMQEDLPSGWWKNFARTTRKRALQARDRIRASTTLEARS